MKLAEIPDNLLFSRQDPEDPRLGEFVRKDEDPSPFTLWGYADDEGISINGGRLGASEAPEHIRHWLYRMSPARSWPRKPLITDRGTWRPEKEKLEERHETVRQAARRIYEKDDSFLITLGGGHDYGFPDGAAFLDAFTQGAKPLILNFDAHLDVRPVDRGLSSGTPFRRLYEKFSRNFDFFEIGIQPHCNSPFHWEWAISQGATILTLETLRKENSPDGLRRALSECLEPDPKRPLWISLDMDAFSSREAPGCSASWPTGLSAEEMLFAWKWIFQSFDVRGLGVYEVSPPLDVGGKTSKLASLMIYQTLHEKLLRDSAG